jgi:hypothetical protein
MVSSSDVIKSIRERLIAESGATWNVAVDTITDRVYPAGVNMQNKKRPFLIVGVESDATDLVQVPDTRRLGVFQVFITCVAAATDQYISGDLSGEVRDAMTSSDVVIKNYTPETPVTVDSRNLVDIEILDVVIEDLADEYGRYSKELTGFISIYQDKT